MYNRNESVLDKIKKSTLLSKLLKTVAAYVALIGLFNYGGIAIQGAIVWFLLFGLVVAVCYWHTLDWVTNKLNEFETMKRDIKTIKAYVNKIKSRGKPHGKK